MSDQSGNSPTFSLLRVLVLALPLAVAAYAGASWYKGDIQRNADEDLAKTTIARMLGPQSQLRMSARYADSDGDLLADAPADEADLIDPAEIAFSYVASTSAPPETPWKELLGALSEQLGKPVKYMRFTDPDEQLRALKAGDLHIAAFGTGEAPTAVDGAGFIPLVVPGDAQGRFGYTMKIIVPAASTMKDPKDIRGQRMTFTRPNSNSGFKAALVLLLDEYDLAPERDYKWGFSYGHEISIEGIAKGELQAASVASDILERMIAAGEVSADAIKTIYESERFPPGTIGCAYNLKPELRNGIEKTLVGFGFAGTGPEEALGGSEAADFVRINYKNDRDNVPRIDAAAAKARSELGGE